VPDKRTAAWRCWSRGRTSPCRRRETRIR